MKPPILRVYNALEDYRETSRAIPLLRSAVEDAEKECSAWRWEEDSQPTPKR